MGSGHLITNCGRFLPSSYSLFLPLSCVFIILSTKIRKYIFGLGHVILYGQQPVSRNSNQRIEICLHGKVYFFVCAHLMLSMWSRKTSQFIGSEDN